MIQGTRQVEEGQDNWGEEDHSDLLANGLVDGLLWSERTFEGFQSVPRLSRLLQRDLFQ